MCANTRITHDYRPDTNLVCVTRKQIIRDKFEKLFWSTMNFDTNGFDLYVTGYSTQNEVLYHVHGLYSPVQNMYYELEAIPFTGPNVNVPITIIEQ
jgi:hypothetical protein